jgi:hypothetical protein
MAVPAVAVPAVAVPAVAVPAVAVPAVAVGTDGQTKQNSTALEGGRD